MKLSSISSHLNPIRRAYSSYRKTQFQTGTFPPTARQSFDALYRNISPLGDPNTSVSSVLDDWARQGNSASKRCLQRLINELMSFRRFKHALEVSLWMTDEKRYPISPFDIGVRLKLILKNFGLEQTENYFNKIPENMKTYQIYLALLNCYTVSKSVDKAESVMQKARDLGFVEKPIWYNLIMNLYCQLGNRQRLDELLIEMESKGISYDQFTYSICLNACVMASDAAGVDRVMRLMESDPAVSVHWRTLVNAAEGYLRMGLIDEALIVLEKLEKWLKKSAHRSILLGFLLKLYAEAGKKEDLYRIWMVCKSGKVVNKLYMSMMRSLMKFNDIEGMEKVFEEWESSAAWFDFRVANFLVDAYCEDGRLEDAEAIVAKLVAKGGNPSVTTWCHLTGGYLKKNQVGEAVRYLRKAISACPPQFTSQKHSLMACLGYLQNDERRDEVEELIKFVRMRGISKEFASDQFCQPSEDGEDQDFEGLLLEENGDDS